MDLEISPEPSEGERKAILAALELEPASGTDRPCWWRAGVEPDGDDED